MLGELKMIKVNQVKKKFQNIQALKGVSFEVHSGKVTGLIGPNGCGKTTMIKSILGLVVPDFGDISVLSVPISQHFNYRKNIGYMPQSPAFPDNLKIGELLEMLENIREQQAKRKDEMLKLFDLEQQLDRVIGQLSGGTKQKVAAVAAFMFDPPILILDEPTVGLDPAVAMRFKKLVASEVKNNKAILLVSHIMSEVEQLVDEMIFLLDGNVVFSGSTHSIIQRAGANQTLEESVVSLIEQK
jgi:Cu-processing system ATP-binding protein